LLVVIALGFSLAIMISIPAGINANQESTQSVTQSLGNMITQTEATINQTLTQIDCSLAPSFEGFGFTPPNIGDFNFTRPDGGSGFNPGDFGGGFAPGRFSGGAFSRGGTIAMNETLYYDISSIEAVAAVVPSLQASEGTEQTVERFGQSFTSIVPDYVIEGVALTSSLIDNYPVLPLNITAGRNLQAGDSGVVLLSENNTAFFGAEVGDTIEILGQNFEVIGIHGSTGVEDATTLYMNLSDAQLVTNNTGYITSLTVFADNNDAVTDVATAISSLHPELSVNTGQQRLDQLEAMKTNYETALENSEATVAQTQSVAVQEIIVTVVATSLIFLFVMLYTVRERTKEIGTLKARGFSNWNVMSQFMLEGILVSLIAAVVGLGIGYVASPTLTSLLLPQISNLVTKGRAGQGVTGLQVAPVELSPELVIVMFGGAILLGALGSLYPAWRASRTSPMEALKYE
jgi:putative ABC transport system permease protein